MSLPTRQPSATRPADLHLPVYLHFEPRAVDGVVLSMFTSQLYEYTRDQMIAFCWDDLPLVIDFASCFVAAVAIVPASVSDAIYSYKSFIHHALLKF